MLKYIINNRMLKIGSGYRNADPCTYSGSSWRVTVGKNYGMQDNEEQGVLNLTHIKVI